jgi:hypothetical protein
MLERIGASFLSCCYYKHNFNVTHSTTLLTLSPCPFFDLSSQKQNLRSLTQLLMLIDKRLSTKLIHKSVVEFLNCRQLCPVLHPVFRKLHCVPSHKHINRTNTSTLYKNVLLTLLYYVNCEMYYYLKFFQNHWSQILRH